MSVAQVAPSRPLSPTLTFLRRQLLHTRRILLTQLASKATSRTAQETPADILDQASCERLCALDELLQERTYGKLRQVEHALDRMRDANYGMCRRCRTDIPVRRLPGTL